MNPEILNLYIEKLVNYITELTKTNLLMSAQVTWLERANGSLNDKIAMLEADLNKLTSKSKKKDQEF
jgi:hypothetical protein